MLPFMLSTISIRNNIIDVQIAQFLPSNGIEHALIFNIIN
jgi:hypothetical protein